MLKFRSVHRERFTTRIQLYTHYLLKVKQRHYNRILYIIKRYSNITHVSRVWVYSLLWSVHIDIQFVVTILSCLYSVNYGHYDNSVMPERSDISHVYLPLGSGVDTSNPLNSLWNIIFILCQTVLEQKVRLYAY